MSEWLGKRRRRTQVLHSQKHMTHHPLHSERLHLTSLPVVIYFRVAGFNFGYVQA